MPLRAHKLAFLLKQPVLLLDLSAYFSGPSVAEVKDSVPPVGGDKKSEQPAKLSDTQDDAGQKKTGEGEEKEGGGQSESLIRDSYLPANKLKDAPPASEYEGALLRQDIPARIEPKI